MSNSRLLSQVLAKLLQERDLQKIKQRSGTPPLKNSLYKVARVCRIFYLSAQGLLQHLLKRSDLLKLFKDKNHSYCLKVEINFRKLNSTFHISMLQSCSTERSSPPQGPSTSSTTNTRLLQPSSPPSITRLTNSLVDCNL